MNNNEIAVLCMANSSQHTGPLSPSCVVIFRQTPHSTGISVPVLPDHGTTIFLPLPLKGEGFEDF